MAKKKYEEQVYPNAPLVITKDEFTKLLNEQIRKGNELLGINVPLATFNDPYMGYARRPVESMEYDEAAEKDFIAKLNNWNNRNKTIYRTSFEVADSIYLHEYESHIWEIWGSDTIKEYKDEILRLMNHMQGDIERSDLMQCSVTMLQSVEKETRLKELSQEVFIVHGHNEEMKQTVARIIDRLGLKPIILHEQPNEGKTIIDKFETNAERISFAIILLSGDDLAASVRDLDGIQDKEVKTKLEKRARQNVVFEMGYFAGKLGRSHMFYLLQDGVAKPGDLDGLVYTPYDSNGAWKYSLVKELKACGYNVDANKVL